MTRTLVSIICPVYNREDSLRLCINSILAQTYKNFELILIDDGSSDKSPLICDEYAELDDRIRVYHNTNHGVSISRQYGITKARGEYSIHVDPDDWIEKDMIEQLYSCAISNNSDMVIMDYFVNIGTRQIYQKQKPTSLHHEDVLKDIYCGLHGNCWNKLIKTSCYSRFGVTFPSEINYREDFCVMTQLLLNPIRISYLNYAGYHYVQHPTKISISSDLSSNKLHDQLLIVDIIQRYLNGRHEECLNILKADIASWLIETGNSPKEIVRENYKKLLNPRIFMSLPIKRKIKILSSFYLGKTITNYIHNLFR